MTSERSKRRDFLSLIFISKSISKKLLIKKIKIIGMLWIVVHRQSPQNQIIRGGGAEGFHNLRSIEGKSVTSRYHGSKFSGSQQYGASMLHSRGLRVE